MNERAFLAIVDELILENPLAVRALLRILEIRFTHEVPTLAVTVEDRPLLLVNLGFVAKHCRTEEQVKAVILHEFLHVLLRHTDRHELTTDADHIATDAVINAIIHRQYGSGASSMMADYYAKERGAMKLLRRRRVWNEKFGAGESLPKLVAEQMDDVWTSLYDGALVVDDLRELANQLGSLSGASSGPAPTSCSPRGTQGPRDRGTPDFIGNHTSAPVPDELRDALENALRQMNGGGIWRSPFRGLGGVVAELRVDAAAVAIAAWKRRTLEILRRYIVPDSLCANRELRADSCAIPVLTPSDRRAFLRTTWSPFIPDALWQIERPRPVGTTQVYLDVSGSMSAEMPHLVVLLGVLRRHIRRPLWSFSTEVERAVIANRRLEARSTGGTSIECALRHIAQTKPAAAVIVTDGYIEPVERAWMKEVKGTRLHAIVTRDGSTNLLDRARIPCTQLERVP